MADAFITGIDLGGRQLSQASLSSSSSGSSVSSVSTRQTGASPTSTPTQFTTFDPNTFNLSDVFDRNGPTNLPPTVNLTNCIAEAEPQYGDTKDELLKHAWTKCFVESNETELLAKDLFWWVLYKVMEANRTTIEPEDIPPIPTAASSPVSTPGKVGKRNRSTGKKRQRRRYFDADGNGNGDDEDEDEEGNGFDVDVDLDEYADAENDDDDRQWLESLNREERAEELKDAIQRGTILSSSKRRKVPTEDLILDRMASSYLSLFRKTCFNIEYFVTSDDPTNNFDDGLLPDPLDQEPVNSIRALSFRGRHVCDKVVGAFPDALAQIVVASLQRAAPRVVDDFGHERLKECASDVMSVCINGMRTSKTKLAHWPARQNPMMRARQTTMGGNSKNAMQKGSKKKVSLIKNLNMLQRKLNKKALERGDGSSTGHHHHHHSTHTHHHTHSKKDESSNVEGEPSTISGGPSVDSPRSTKLTHQNQQNPQPAEIKDELTRLEEDGSESTPLEQRHIVTRTRFCLGHSHFIGKLVEQNNMTSTMRKRELKITLTTSSQRPDLIPSLESKGSDGGRRQGTDVFGWVAKETIGKRGGQDTEKRRQEEEEFNKRYIPMTVRSALIDSRLRIAKIQERHAISKKQNKRAVHEIQVRLGIDLQGIRKEARRAKSGDVNELANELSGLNVGKKKR